MGGNNKHIIELTHAGPMVDVLRLAKGPTIQAASFLEAWQMLMRVNP